MGRKGLYKTVAHCGQRVFVGQTATPSMSKLGPLGGCLCVRIAGQGTMHFRACAREYSFSSANCFLCAGPPSPPPELEAFSERHRRIVMRVDNMIDRVVARFIGTKHERDVKQIQPLVDAINALAPEYEQLSDAQFLEKTAQLRTQVKERLGDLPLDDPQYKERCKEALEPALVPAFAMVREAGRRKLGMRHFDVQLIGGIVLHEGKIAEMKTGEGKTLVATLPAVLNALTGRGVHIVTVNDYLARRDAEWMSPIYRALGMTVGVI